MAAISRQSSKAPAPHRFVDQFKTRGKHNEIQNGPRPRRKLATQPSFSHSRGDTHVMGRRELVIRPPHNPAFHCMRCSVSAPPAPTGRDRRSIGISLSAAGTRYHPCQHWPLPVPNHDQHRAKQSSTGRRVREPPLPRRSGRVSQHRDRRPVRASRLARSSSDEPGGAPTCAGGDPS